MVGSPLPDAKKNALCQLHNTRGEIKLKIEYTGLVIAIITAVLIQCTCPLVGITINDHAPTSHDLVMRTMEGLSVAP